ncbi:MAG: MaoC family dehydratase [Bacteroidia bacterium]|nr:MaoC family dehydratase [Bacteroidia bacterium]
MDLSVPLIQPGDTYEQPVTFTQEQVAAFADVSGDRNPLHLDAEYTARTAFRRPIVHGFLAGSVFSRILGMEFPGEGSIYLEQSMQFLRPVYPGTACRVLLTVLEADPATHRARIRTQLFQTGPDKLLIDGEALVLHKKRI